MLVWTRMSDMTKGWDKRTVYRAVRWTLKWTIVVMMLTYILSDLRHDERAAEARLQRIEARLDSLGAVQVVQQAPAHEDTLISVLGQRLIIRSTP